MLIVQAEDDTDKVTEKLTAEMVVGLITELGGIALGPFGVLAGSAAGTVTGQVVGIIAGVSHQAIGDQVKGTTDPIAVSVYAGGVVEYHTGDDVRVGGCS